MSLATDQKSYKFGMFCKILKRSIDILRKTEKPDKFNKDLSKLLNLYKKRLDIFISSFK